MEVFEARYQTQQCLKLIEFKGVSAHVIIIVQFWIQEPGNLYSFGLLEPGIGTVHIGNEVGEGS